MRVAHAAVTLLAVVALGCAGEDDADRRTAARTADDGGRGVATAIASGSSRLSPEELEAGRLDSDWRRYAEEARARRQRAGQAAGDTTPGAGTGAEADRAAEGAGPGEAGDTAAAEQSWEDISPESVNASPRGLPLSGDIEGPAVARLQILLDRARFSPGVIDGRWGKNTEKAVFWFQETNGMEATGEAERRTMDRLGREGGGGEVVRRHTLSEEDVAGPFVSLPGDPQEQEALDCMCYESLREKIGELFHATPELIEQLNPDVDLNSVSAGQTLQVPAVEPFRPDDLPEGRQEGSGEVARIVISDGGRYLHAMDASGTLLYHFPSTLGADYSPSPTGQLSVESVHFHPTWHFQPEILTGVDEEESDALVPPGPNNAVGIVWMQLSREHYGIHGTDAPETIGYATSNGCVRLTNWDAAFLAQRVADGTTVEFRDITGREQVADE